MKPRQWIDEFLQKRNLAYEDIGLEKRPIYQFRITDEEFESLNKTLKLSSLLGLQHVFKDIMHWDAIFVVYAAEWWRREYDGSSWKWENIFASFNADVKELNTAQRNFMIEKGLNYWQRDLRKINGRIRYLGSIAIEGGLPLKQLTNSGTNGGWLGRVFKQAIPKYMRFKSSGVTAIEVVSEYEAYFPKTYRNEQIYSILGDMLDTVVSLKVTHQLHEKTKPIEYLNQHVSDWRAQFPLPIADDTSEKLLSDMISTAVKVGETEGKNFRVIRFLNSDNHIAMGIEFKRFIEISSLLGDAGGKVEENIPPKLEVEIVSGDNCITRIGFALKTNYKGKPCLRMPCLNYDVDGDRATQQHLIRFKHLSTIVKQIPLIGGESLDDDLPWVFRLQNESWILDGVASVSTRAKKVRVLYPKKLTCDADNQKNIEDLEQKKLIEASGIIRLKDHESAFVIKTAQSTSTEHFYLRGQSIDFSSHPKELYIGLPALMCLNPETELVKEIPTAELIARAINSKEAWKPLSSVRQGIYEIRFQGIDGNIKFRKKCVLLSKNFKIRLKPLINSLDGIICLDHAGSAEVICDSNIRHRITRDDDTVHIELNAEDLPPSQIKLSLRWHGLPETLGLTLPFPVRGGKLVDPDGQVVKQSHFLFLENLYGYRIRLMSENPKQNKKLLLEFNLVDHNLRDVKGLYFREQISYEGAVIELSIIDFSEWIKKLLSMSKSLDSYVNFSVYESGRSLVTVKIYQYQMSLQRNEMEGYVDLDFMDSTQLSYLQIANVKLKAMRLSQPEEKHITLEERRSENTEVGSWFFYPEKRVAEPWLIYPCKDSAVLFRPLLWMGSNESEKHNLEPLEISTLHSAVMLESPVLRQLVIKKVLAKMCFDFTHSGWDYLKILAKEMDHLPLACFDIWSVVVTENKMLIALVLQMEQRFIEKLTAELPVFWEFISLSEWLVVFEQYQRYLQQQMGDDFDVNILVESRINRLDYLPDSIGIVAKILKIILCENVDQELNLMTMPAALDIFVFPPLNDAKQELERRPKSDDWSLDKLENEIIQYWNGLNEVEQSLVNIDNVRDQYVATLLLPVLLAKFCLTEVPEYWLADAIHIFKLKQLKSFDDDWFNTAFNLSLAYLSQLPEYKLQLQDDLKNKRNGNRDLIEHLNQQINCFNL